MGESDARILAGTVEMMTRRMRRKTSIPSVSLWERTEAPTPVGPIIRVPDLSPTISAATAIDSQRDDHEVMEPTPQGEEVYECGGSNSKIGWHEYPSDDAFY